VRRVVELALTRWLGRHAVMLLATRCRFGGEVRYVRRAADDLLWVFQARDGRFAGGVRCAAGAVRMGGSNSVSRLICQIKSRFKKVVAVIPDAARPLERHQGSLSRAVVWWPATSAPPAGMNTRRWGTRLRRQRVSVRCRGPRPGVVANAWVLDAAASDERSRWVELGPSVRGRTAPTRIAVTLAPPVH
jgi:hypothetical protein